jgi:hypothetical protein
MDKISLSSCNASTNNILTFDPNNAFKYNDFYKEFSNHDECISHAKTLIDDSVEDNTINIDFGQGLKKYELIIYNVHDKNDRNQQKWFLIANEILKQEEIDILLPFCRCRKCTAMWGIRWTYCACCTGCINNDFGTPDYIIKKTRKYYYNQVTDEI